jgi:hypothetical protein
MGTWTKAFGKRGGFGTPTPTTYVKRYVKRFLYLGGLLLYCLALQTFFWYGMVLGRLFGRLLRHGSSHLLLCELVFFFVVVEKVKRQL